MSQCLMTGEQRISILINVNNFCKNLLLLKGINYYLLTITFIK